MSELLTALRDRYNKAVTDANALGDQITALLREGATLDDERIAPLNVQRLKAYQDVDAALKEMQAEQGHLDAQKSGNDLLEQYGKAGFVAPKSEAAQVQERINKIVTPSLRLAAIEHPVLVSDEYRGALNAYLRQSIQKNDDKLPFAPFLQAAGLEANVMEMITDDLGGYTVPVDVQDDILRNLPHFSTMRRLCPITPTDSNQVEWALIQRAAGGDKGIYTGTFVGSMVTETPAATTGEQDLKFQVINIMVRKARVIGWLLEDFVKDSRVDILDMLREEGAMNLGLLEDQQLLTGDGEAGEVLGLMNHPQAASPTAIQIKTRDISGTTADTISNLTTDRGSEAKILDLIDDVPSQYLIGPRVAMIGHATTRTKIRGLVSPGGDFVWRQELAESARTEESGRAGSVEGIPFYVNNRVAQDGTNGNKVLPVGNFGFFRIVDRESLAVRVSMEQKFDVEQVGIRLNSRFGGRVVNPEAFAIGIV